MRLTLGVLAIAGGPPSSAITELTGLRRLRLPRVGMPLHVGGDVTMLRSGTTSCGHVSCFAVRDFLAFPL